MTRISALLTLLLLCSPLTALARLVQIDGAVVALGENRGLSTRTFLFPSSAVKEPAWLLLPAGAVVTEVQVASQKGRTVLPFPVVSVPGLRFAVQIAAQTLSVAFRGRLPENPAFSLTRSLPGGPWVARSPRSLSVDLPRVKIAAGWTPVLEVTHTGGPWDATVSLGGRSRTFSFREAGQWNYWPGAWGFLPDRLEFGGDPRVSKISLTAVPAAAPISADPDSILAWPVNRWRDARREWFHWSGTSVLVLVTKDYDVQDEYLKRLAFYVEKTGFRGRLVPDEEMAGLHGWNAHDYAAPDLARFFSQAAREGFALNSSEVELRDRLVEAGTLIADGAVWRAGTGALVGISMESGPSLRRVLFVHEGFHGLYFTSDAFRRGTRQAWDSLSEATREQFRSYLALSNYDPGDEALMINEFQAYVLQRTALEWKNFFRTLVVKKASALQEERTLNELLAAAAKLDLLVKNLFGVRSGSIFKVTASGT